jgi:uncharacterized protein YdaL
MEDLNLLYYGPFDPSIVVEYIRQYGKNQISVNMTDIRRNICKIFIDDEEISIKTAIERQIDIQIKMQKGEL